MGMVVRSNIMAMNANRSLGMNQSAVAKSLEKLSSGFKINRAGDDASGLAISEKMKAQIKGLETASANSQDGISLVQTAEGALTEVHSMLNRMVELATKSANGTIQDEVDREAIQSEVDALLSEVDRISQSTNFNGINLLDGSMGLNTKAITIGDTVEATPGSKIDLSSFLPASTEANKTILHLGTKGNAQGAPSFSVSLGDLAIKKGTSAAGDTSTVAITIGGQTFTTDALAGGKDYTTKDIRDALIAKINTLETSEGANSAGKFGDFYFKAEADGDNGIKLTYAGMAAKTTTAADTDEFTADQATAINNVLSNGVTLGGTVHAKSQKVGDVFHDSLNVTNAVAKKEDVRAGIDFTLDATVVKDGNRLTIDGKTFVFKTKADSKVTAGDGETLIDVSGAAFDTDAKKIAEAVDLISHGSSANFKFEAKSGTTIHIDQKVGNTNSYTKYEDLTSLFSAKGPDSNAGTKVTIDPTKLSNGNTLNIGGETFTFVKTATGAENEVVLGDNGASALTNLTTALAAKGFSATANGNELIIRAKNAADGAPAIVGGGLTLQIGDTGDNFNMVRVKVGDMSSDGLGIQGLDVSNADSARAAIDTIKNAINTVSTNRADMGALQNRLEYTINNLDVATENLSAANSRIRDTDMAKEMMNYTKMNVLTQAAQAMLAQANQQPQSILQLPQ